MDKLVKNKNYYNNIYDIDNGILNIDRVYMVDEYAFKDDTYDELAKIYRKLPGYVFDPHEVICWYGDFYNNDEYYLYVTFEPSGLHFKGKLREEDFEEWEEEFHKLIIKMPFKKI